ncbi:MAG: Uma2 family endonuclease [Ornithinimicrobium sp.]|jgi:Uma2 family endonuclease|uniref:Uma2 family endonuclease n=1 Tax=Ornithinimicrobium sp. TaxID=1977084 RepID=UPI003D9BD7A0
MDSMTALPQSRPLTALDLESLREVEDGHRYELIDGSLIVTPAPVPRHQIVAFALARTLHAAVPAYLQVLMAPLDVRIDDMTVLQPDILVVARPDVGDRYVRHPVLAVEVLSPSTRTIDLTLKKARYERAGCTSYWVVDPEAPSLTAWELRKGSYQLVADSTAPADVTLARPFAVQIHLAALLD